MKIAEAVTETPNGLSKIYQVKCMEDVEPIFKKKNSVSKVSIRQSTFLWYIHKNRYNINCEYDINQMKELMVQTISRIYKDDTNTEDIIISKKDLSKLKRNLVT